MADSFQSKQLFEEISKTIDVIGADKLISVLQNERNEALKTDDPKVNFVFRIVTENIGITIEELVNSRTNTMKRRMATGFIVYYLYYRCELSLGDMRVHFKKSRSVLSERKTVIERMQDNEKNKFWIEKKKYFDTAISNFQIS